MGCVCNAPLLSDNHFECSFITLKFSENSEEQLEKIAKKSKVPCESANSSPGSCKTSDSKSIPRLQKTIQPVKNCIISGDLMKYHPGLSFQFTSRYCVLKANTFEYFKSQHSFTLDEKPLLSVPVSEIVSVNHVTFQTSEKQKKFCKSNNFFQFEVFIRDEDEMTGLSRRTDKTPLDREIIEKTAVSDSGLSVQSGKLVRRPIKVDVNRAEVKLDRSNWTMREVEWCTAEKRLLFSAKSQKDANDWVNEIENVILSN